MSMAQVDRLPSVVINAFGLKLIDSFRGLSWSALCLLSFVFRLVEDTLAGVGEQFRTPKCV